MFFFLRHGETNWNREHRVQGQVDVPMNDTGLEQARRACNLVRGLPVATMCASPLSRALDTAIPLQTLLGCELEVIDDLAECSWGEREGDVKGQWFEDWKAGIRNPDGAESYAQFIERALRGINKCLERPGPVLIVSHGGVYWSVQKYAALGSEFDIPNAIPLRHDPPGRDYPWWTATVLEAAG
jgi:probable phosphoglycerate mutase